MRLQARTNGRWSTVAWSTLLLLLLLALASELLSGGLGSSSAGGWQLLPPVHAQSTTNCTQQSTALHTGNRTVNIAILFWGPPGSDNRFGPNSDGSFRVVWPRNPMLDGWNGSSSNEIRFLRAYLLWQERMELPAVYGGGAGLILLDGSVMRLNVTFFHAGEFATLKGPGEFTDLYQNSWANKLITRLADANGPYGRQHFLMSPLNSNSQVTILASLACEASGTCLMVSPGAAESRQFICQDPMPQDCVQRGKRKGSRRFENTVSAYSNTDYWASGSMSLVVNQGFKRIYAIGELWSVNALGQMSATAKLLGMQVVGTLEIATFTTSWSAYNTTAAEVTERIRDLNVDMVVVLNTFEGTTALHQLMDHWRSIGFLPGAVAYLTGGASYLPPDLAAYFLIEVQWLSTLTGSQYRAVKTELNFETFPSNATHDSPAIFADAFAERFGYRPSDQVFFDSARTFHAPTIVQKLLELAQTEDTESLKQAAARIATPGVYHAVQFDQWGRSLPFDNYVLQLMPDGGTRVLTPLGLGSTPVLPIPSWSEREYKAVFLSKTSDRVAFSLAAVTIVYLLGWLACLLTHWHHPLIRVSDPFFSALSLCGLMVLTSSSFFNTFHQNDASCRAFVGLFVFGVTLAFAPLVLKNLRIWSLWHNSSSFNPAPIRQWHMFCALCVLLLIDGAVHLSWALDGGMRALRSTPDPYRPSLDFYECDFFSQSFYIGIVAWKACCLAAAMYLAYLLRNVSSTFSESRFIALCMYNVTIVLAIYVPVTATSAAGHEGTYLVRNYLLLFLCVSTSSIMCVPKLMAIRSAAPRTRGLTNESDRKSHHTRAEQTPSSPDAGGSPLPDTLSRHPPGGAGAADMDAKRLPGLPAGAAEPIVHSAHFPGSAAVVPVAGSPPAAAAAAGVTPQLRAAARQSQWEVAGNSMALPFQSMLGLSQVERPVDSRLDEESGVHHHHRDTHNRASNARSSNARRAPGVELTSPTPLLEQAALTPIPQSGYSSPSLLRATLDLLSELPNVELEQIHSSLLRRRQVTPSHVQSHSHHSIHYQYQHHSHSQHHSISDHSVHSGSGIGAHSAHSSGHPRVTLASPTGDLRERERERDRSERHRQPSESPASQTVLTPPSLSVLTYGSGSGSGSLPLSAAGSGCNSGSGSDSAGSTGSVGPITATGAHSAHAHPNMQLPRQSLSSYGGVLQQSGSGSGHMEFATRSFDSTDEVDQTVVSFHEE